MAIVHFDSSAFVKLVVDEDGSALMAGLWDGCDAAVSSRLAYPEVGLPWRRPGAITGWTQARTARSAQTWEEYCWRWQRPAALSAEAVVH